MNEDVTKIVIFSPLKTLIFDTHVLAVFAPMAEKFQKVPLLAGVKTGF
ncbi:MAG: hypothetical protein Q4C43_11845 [Prevotella sp.]|nr:hypothetical protein [Prevotella sp.]